MSDIGDIRPESTGGESGAEPRTRRSVLTSVGTGAAAVTLLTTDATASPKDEVIRLQGTYSDPVTMAEVQEARKRVARSTHASHLKGGADPDYPGNGRMVEYVVAPRGNGIPRQFVGVAGNPAGVAGVRDRADEKESTFGRAPTAATVGTGTTFQTTQTGDGWNKIVPGDDEGYYEEPPYGAVQNNFDWWKLDDSKEEDGRNMHSIRQYHSQIPGRNMDGSEYDGSEWQNEYARDKHWWNRGEQTAPELRDWDPQQEGSGEYSVTLSTSTEPLSWSFPINNTDLHTNTDFTKPTMEVKFQIWGKQYRRSTMSFDPGSRCEVEEHSCGRYDLLEFRSYAGMQHAVCGNRNALWFDWTLWWDFGNC